MDEKQYLETLERLWAKNWPRNLPKEIEYPLGEVLLTDYLRERARRHPAKPAVIYYGTEMTFGELDDLSDRFASFLAAKGLKKGDRVAVLLANCPQFLIVFYGILKLGCIHVPVNPLFKEREFLYEMEDTKPRLIVTLDLLYPLVQATKEKTTLETVVVTNLGDFLPDEPAFPVPDLAKMPPMDCPGTLDLDAVLRDQGRQFPEAEIGLDDIAAMNYTGGTTGLPKGCEHTQRDMVYTAASVQTFTTGGVRPDDIFLTYLPVFHHIFPARPHILHFSGIRHNLAVRYLPHFSGFGHVILFGPGQKPSRKNHYYYQGYLFHIRLLSLSYCYPKVYLQKFT